MIKMKYKPLKGPFTISSRYGPREYGGLEFHPGMDFIAPIGTPIYAVDNGFVAVAWDDPQGYGLYVVLDHGHYCTLYAHLREQFLTTGQLVSAGEIIGYVGMTGLTSGPHLHFEIRDSAYSDKNFWLKSNLKGRHVMCIDPEKLVEEAAEVSEITSNIIYKKYNNNIHELKGNPTDLEVKIVDKRIWDITEYTNCTNGTFYWYDDKGKTYATSILIINGEIKKNEADHYNRFGCPQNVFIIYKNGKVEMKKIYFAHDLDYKNIKIAVGGVGLRDTTNPNFKYDPASEGFKKGINKITGKTEDQSGVLAKRNKTVIGYSKTTGKVYLLVVRSIAHGELIKLISTGEAYDIALSLDGGGSTFMDANKQYVFEGENARRIHNIIGFNL